MTVLIGGIIVAVITALGAVIVASIAKSSNKQVTAVQFASQLNERLERVELKVVELESALSKSQRALQSAIRFIDRLVDWGRLGGKSSMPKPPRTLHEYLDGDTWPSEATQLLVEELET